MPRIADKQLVSGAEYLKRDGSVPLTGTLDAGSQLISNLAEPVVGSDAATKTYADSVGGGGLTDWAADAPALSLTGWYDAQTVGAANAANPAAALVGGGIMFGVERNSTGAPPHEVIGLLRDIAAGDFRVGFSVAAAMHNTVEPLLTTALTGFVGACFCDGQSADVGSDNLYAMGVGWGGAAFFNPSATGFRWTLAGERWDAAEANITSTTYYAESTMDVVLERVGTTLSAYWARRGELFSFANAWTVGAGAGRIGIRGRFDGSFVADYMRAFLRAFDPALAAVPYRT